MTTTVFEPLPLRQHARGLTVIPPDDRAAYLEALAAARAWAAGTDTELLDDGPFAEMFRHLWRNHIRPMRDSLLGAILAADTAAQQLQQAQAELEQLREEEHAARLRRALQAERRDKALRGQARERDGDQCRYCGAEITLGGRGGAVLDHVIPDLAAGVDNLVTACRPCQRAKGHRTPDEAGMALREPPTTPHHIAREETMPRPIPKTEDVTPPAAPEPLPAGHVRLTVTYPTGSVAAVEWGADLAQEPTPDELGELLKLLLPDTAPVAIAVDRPQDQCDPYSLMARAVGDGQLPQLPWRGHSLNSEFIIIDTTPDDTLRLHVRGGRDTFLSWENATRAALAVLAAADLRTPAGTGE